MPPVHVDYAPRSAASEPRVARRRHQRRRQVIPTGVGGSTASVLTVLGASLALSVVLSCALFYIVGQKSESGPSGEKQENLQARKTSIQLVMQF